MKCWVIIGLAVCALFAAMIVYANGSFHRGHRGNGTIQIADRDLKSFESALERYQEIGGQYPSQEQGLAALVKKPKIDPSPERWAQLFQDEDSFFDPWDTPYRYQYPGIQSPEKPEIISAGPDKIFGTDDDQSNQD